MECAREIVCVLVRFSVLCVKVSPDKDTSVCNSVWKAPTATAAATTVINSIEHISRKRKTWWNRVKMNNFFSLFYVCSEKNVGYILILFLYFLNFFSRLKLTCSPSTFRGRTGDWNDDDDDEEIRRRNLPRKKIASKEHKHTHQNKE